MCTSDILVQCAHLVRFSWDVSTVRGADFFQEGAKRMRVGCEQVFGELKLIGGYRMVSEEIC